MALQAPKSAAPTALPARNLLQQSPALVPAIWQPRSLASGPQGATIWPVQGLDSPYLPIAIRLFREIFPHQHHYLPQIYQAVQQRPHPRSPTVDHVWVIEQQGRWVGVRLISYLPARNIGHGGFIGIAPAQRSQGLGAWLVEQTQIQLGLDAARSGNSWPQGYCAEVEPVSGACNLQDREIRTRRLNFHRRCGALLLDIAYLEPALYSSSGIQIEPPKPMQLVFYPLLPRTDLSQAELLNVVEGLYLDVYKLPPASWYLQRASDSIARLL